MYHFAQNCSVYTSCPNVIIAVILILFIRLSRSWDFQVAPVIKNPSANAGEERDTDSIQRSARSPGGGHGNTFQYSCLESPRDGGTW